jgi:hypothetical protein
LRQRANRSSKTGHGMTLLLSAALTTFALLAFSAAPAIAVETHAFTEVTIGPGGKAAAGRFTNLTSVSVDPSSGDLYVLDTAKSGRLYKFDSAGEPLDFTGTGTNFIEGTGGFNGNTTVVNQVAIAPPGAAGGTAGDIYIANSEVLKIYSPAGLEIGQLTEPSKSLCGVAVDATGNVFTKNERSGEVAKVRKYAPTANPPTNADESASSTVGAVGTCNLAVDGKGHIYLSGRNSTDNKLWKLQSLTAEVAQLVDPNSRTVAVEPGTDDVYASNESEITQYGEDGSVISKFGEGSLIEATGLGIAGADGDVYVGNGDFFQKNAPILSGRVEVYGPLATLPKAVAVTAGTFTKTSAVLHGTISADGGPAATCKFEYTTQASFATEKFVGAASAPCTPAGPFSGESIEAVSAEAPGLSAGTEYRFRLVAHNENGSLASNENGSQPKPGEVPRFETLPAFNVQTGPATALTTSSATLTGSINPEGVNVDECFFEYGKTTTYGSVAPCVAPSGAEVGSGNAPVAVHAAVPGLTEATEYHYRLVGGSPEFGAIKVLGADAIFGTLGLPTILSEAFSGVGQTGATISGSINPHSSPTTYVVEYVTDAAFLESGYTTASKVPSGGEAIGSGFAEVKVSQTLSGLTPGTKYHFRLSASNDVGGATGTDRVFTTQGTSPLFEPCPANEPFRIGWSATLPDCRAYEQASSPDKNGDSVGGLYPSMFASEDGSAVTFVSVAAALPPAQRGGAQTFPTYKASRDAVAGSWSSQRLLPPQELGERGEFLGSTPDLRYAVVEAGSGKETGLFVIDTEDGAVTQITPYEPKGAGRVNQFGFDGASADGSRIFFESTATLPITPANPAPAPGHVNLYMWERSTEDVSLVGVLPAGEGGEAPPAGSFGGAYEWYEDENLSTGGTLNKPGNVTESLAVAGLHALPASGEQIFFTAAGTGQLYLRRGLGGTNPTTVRISSPNAGVTSPTGEFPAAFLEATPDGSRAFFMSRQKLTANAASGENATDKDLYRWDASAATGQELTDIAPGAEVQGLLGVNPAGSAGYFIGRGVLAAKAEVGKENLYRFAEKAAGGFRITFIATLAKGGAVDRRNVSPKVNLNESLGRTSRLSENGEALLFASANSLTGYDNVNAEGISCPGGSCPELYLYSAQTGKVTCVSCDPTGSPPLGAASLQTQFFNAYFTPAAAPAVSFSRNLSADGTKVFFQTPDPLVASDTNGEATCPASGGEVGQHNLAGTGRCQDVYEWEAVGSGSCKVAEANGGCLYLLSTGQSPDPTYFVAAGKYGASAFLATTSQLVPSDRDQVDDVYAARVDGGLASQYATAAVPCSSAEACKTAGTSPAPGASPGTSSFQGPGNPKPKQSRHQKKSKKHHSKKHKKHNKKKRAAKKHSGGAK